MGRYSAEKEGNPLWYEVEYIIGGALSDRENLRFVVNRLFAVREAANAVYLFGSEENYAIAKALGEAIAAALMVPEIGELFTVSLVLGWAFAESVLDVRELFAGGKIPLVKISADWQISLSNLSSLMEGVDSMRKNNEHGLSYEDYLQVLILPVSKEKKVMRAMDMIEDAIRKKGRANFYMDSCVVALEAFAEIKANRKKEFQVIRQYCYE